MRIKRNVGLDILRILAIILIVMGHIYNETSLNESKFIFNLDFFLASAFGHLERIAINLFLMISAWFLCDKDFEARRLLKVWLMVFILNVLITSLIFATGVVPFSFIYMIQSAMPIIGRPQWYMCEYLILLLLHPMLKKISIDVRGTKAFLIIGFLFIVLCDSIPVNYTWPMFSETIWFCYVFLLMSYIKKTRHILAFVRQHYRIMVIILICGVTIHVAMNIINGLDLNNQMVRDVIIKMTSHYNSHYEALPGFVIALMAFFIFEEIDFSTEKKLIGIVANATGAIYIVHTVPVFWRYADDGFTIWNGIFHIESMFERGYIFGGMIQCMLIVITVGVIAYYLCNVFIDRFLFKLFFIKQIEEKINKALK